MSSGNPSTSKRIMTAVEFLKDVHSKGYSDSVLKKYLIEKRHLTAEEVDIAFVINKNRMEKAKESREEPIKNRERPEKPTSFSARKQSQDVCYLMPSKQTEGEKLINEFLDCEKAYCQILECLEKEYHVQLSRLAIRNKFQISRREIDEMFCRIPELLKFHNGFFLDLKRGSSIGKMFVQLFKFFEGYAEYMKDCQLTVNKMRKYIRDSALCTTIALISEHSKLKNDDMVDLLLTPLERILDYRDFLTKLLSWTDKTMTTDYDLLGKASRRIGRVAAYIENYKYSICNQNEMNKVQKFLRDQCDILAPDRVIVRRGMMIRRTTSWHKRNKRYVFFLFNDMLLWTNKNGVLQNALQLRRCEIMGSSAKNDSKRKFELVYRGEKYKTLRLECDKVTERNDWYKSIQRTITAAKVTSSQAWSRSKSLIRTKYKEYPDDLSDEDQKTSKSVDYNRVEEEDISKVEPSEQIDDPYNKRYAVSTSFRIQEFKEMDPMDDNVSQISEQDVAFHQERRNYLRENGLSASAIMSPFENPSDKVHKRDDSNSIVIIQSPDRDSKGRGGSVVLVRKKSPQREDQDTTDERFEFFDQHKKTNIIRHSSSSGSVISPNPSERFTVRLQDF